MADRDNRPTLVASDLEGVLIPEIWIAVAEKTGIKQLHLTTRDIPDYNELMTMRLDILRRQGITIHDVQKVAAALEPLPGALKFLNWLRARTQLVIISDTFYEFIMPLMVKLNYPTVFCHSLDVAEDGTILSYRLRLPKHSKRKAVQAFRELGFRTLATGDSYNDTAMLETADTGILFRPPDNVVADFPHFPIAHSYKELQEYISGSLLEPAL
jgi:phosphoserine / homoserine phosphotransferase